MRNKLETKSQKPQNKNTCLTNLNIGNIVNFPILAFRVPFVFDYMG